MKRSVPKKRRPLIIILIIVFLILAALTVDSNVRLVTTEYEIYSDKLPESFDGLRVVQLSDLHGDKYGRDNSKLYEAVIAAKPDIIALTGDLFDEYTDPDYAVTTCRELLKIAPVYYVSGNHEWAKNPRDTFSNMREVCVNVLRNDYVILEQDGESIVLAGVDDPNGPYDMISREDFVSEIRSETDDYILMLCHRNSEFDTWVDLNVDLVLSGHAHGGIIRLPGIGGLLIHRDDFRSKRVEGTFTKGDTTMVVSRGAGGNGFIPRFYNNPEIVVVVLRSN
ncbi:MAG: metallophosphoesterase [Ruminococcaceae bacterium]|nr:metallophosphoesterase [Oscillospiraceae bacterium]